MPGGLLPPVIAEIRASTSEFTAKMAAAKAEIDELATHGASASNKLATLGKGLTEGLAGGALAVGGAGIKLAADFQKSMTQLVTGAGESKAAIDQVSQGILAMAGQVGQTPQQLAQGMYMIESAGYHGAAGLKVLKAAAEGAAVGGADMASVADALTSALHDYHIPAKDANQVTSALITTIAQGKTHLQDLANSMGMVLPTAAALGVSFPQVQGALATMTVSGMNARRASMELANSLRALGAPSTLAQKSMQQIGLSAQQVHDALSTKGLTGTLQLIEQHVGTTFPADSVQAVTALKNIMGGATGYNAALMLGGKNMAIYEENVRKIGAALGGAGGQVKGFSDVQKDLSFQLDQAKAMAESMGIKVGEFLIPKIEVLAKDVEHATVWLSKHKDVLYALGAVTLPLVGAAMGAFAVNKIAQFVSSMQKASATVLDLGAKLLGVGTTADTVAADVTASSATMEGDLSAVAAEADTAAAQMATVGMGSTAAAGLAGGVPTGAAAKEALTLDGTAAAEAIRAAEIEGAAVAATDIGGAEAAGGLRAGEEIGAAEAAGGRVAAEEVGLGEMAGGTGAGAGGLLRRLFPAALGDAATAGLGPALLGALGGSTILNMAQHGLRATAMHKPTAADVTHPSQWLPDLADGIVNALHAAGLVGGSGSNQPHTYMQRLTEQVAKDKTVSAKFDTLQSSAKAQASALAQMESWKDFLTHESTLKQSEAHLKELKSTLASEKTLGMNKQAIDSTTSEIQKTTQHISQLKGVTDQITKAKDTLSQTEKLAQELAKIATQTKGVTSTLDRGLTVRKLPDTRTRASGSIQLRVT